MPTTRADRAGATGPKPRDPAKAAGPGHDDDDGDATEDDMPGLQAESSSEEDDSDSDSDGDSDGSLPAASPPQQRQPVPEPAKGGAKGGASVQLSMDSYVLVKKKPGRQKKKRCKGGARAGAGRKTQPVPVKDQATLRGEAKAAAVRRMRKPLKTKRMCAARDGAPCPTPPCVLPCPAPPGAFGSR